MKKIVNRVLCAFMAVLLVVLSAAELSVVSAESVGTVKFYPSPSEVSGFSGFDMSCHDSILSNHDSFLTDSDLPRGYPNFKHYCNFDDKYYLFDASNYR